MYTRVHQHQAFNLNTKFNHQDDKLAYFVECFGANTIRSWAAEESIICYDGIESFKIYAQGQVDRAPTTSAKEKLAELFQLKVATNRRDEWENSIRQASLYMRNTRSKAMVNF